MMNDERIEFGNRLRKLRTLNGMRIADVADKLGVTVASVSFWERGVNYPNNARIRALAELFNTPVEILRYGKKDVREIEHLSISMKISNNEVFTVLSIDDVDYYLKPNQADFLCDKLQHKFEY